jgi:hypothetical protein
MLFPLLVKVSNRRHICNFNAKEVYAKSVGMLMIRLQIRVLHNQVQYFATKYTFRMTTMLFSKNLGDICWRDDSSKCHKNSLICSEAIVGDIQMDTVFQQIHELQIKCRKGAKYRAFTERTKK